MSKSTYSHLSSTSDIPLNDTSTISYLQESPSLGRPRIKPYIDPIDLIALLASLACLILSICLVTPRLRLSWQLGFANQIVAIGALLSLMNFCLRRILPTVLLIVEARWGESRLQNFSAVLSNSVLISKTAFHWRLLLFATLILPLSLSAAYKRFTGGRNGVVVAKWASAAYGLDSLPGLGAYEALSNAINIQFNATLGFLQASAEDSFPLPHSLPQAYGYNMLLLSNSSAAALDVPESTYLGQIQSSLGPYETWRISATVNATVSQYNENVTSDIQANFDSYNRTFSDLIILDLYHNVTSIGMIVNKYGAPSQCLIGTVAGVTGYAVYETGDALDPKNLDFQKSAMFFSCSRERCSGTWEVTSTTVRLLSGSCSGTKTDQSVLWNNPPYWGDVMPSFIHTLGPFSVERAQSIWLLPSYAVQVAAMYWSRVYWLGRANPGFATFYTPEIAYPATDEHIISFRQTLDPQWLLYIVLATQPVLTILCFIATTFFHSSPIDKGFGTVAILAGMDQASLSLLRGAALSGELDRPVRMNFAVRDSTYNPQEGTFGRVEYSLSLPANEKRYLPTLRRQNYYG